MRACLPSPPRPRPIPVFPRSHSYIPEVPLLCSRGPSCSLLLGCFGLPCPRPPRHRLLLHFHCDRGRRSKTLSMSTHTITPLGQPIRSKGSVQLGHGTLGPAGCNFSKGSSLIGKITPSNEGRSPASPEVTHSVRLAAAWTSRKRMSRGSVRGMQRKVVQQAGHGHRMHTKNSSRVFAAAHSAAAEPMAGGWTSPEFSLPTKAFPRFCNGESSL